MFIPELIIFGRSSGSPCFFTPSHSSIANSGEDKKAVIRLTATGIAPDLHRFPFSFRFKINKCGTPNSGAKIIIITFYTNFFEYCFKWLPKKYKYSIFSFFLSEALCLLCDSLCNSLLSLHYKLYQLNFKMPL